MDLKKRVFKILKITFVTLVALLVVVVLSIGRIVRYAMTPKQSFAAQAPPTAPDYDRPEAWSAHPERRDTADVAPSNTVSVDQASAMANVFYVHPTSYVASRWNAPINDPALNTATDRVATGIQASAFNGCCAIWAPRYRQSNGTSFFAHSDDGDRAIDLAYSDVRRAFAHFVAHGGTAKPFIIAAHSQGSVMAERLLIEEINNTPLRDTFVAAYLMGGRVTIAGLRERAPNLLPCDSPTQTQCVIAWNARGPNYTEGPYEMHRPDPRERLCTNPLSWRGDGQAMPSSSNLGAVFLETSDHAVRPHFADAQCSNGVLIIKHIEQAPRDFLSEILDHTLGAENYHPIEYQIFFMNIRRNAEQRVAAMRASVPAGTIR